jgi:hypothetical protein
MKKLAISVFFVCSLRMLLGQAPQQPLPPHPPIAQADPGAFWRDATVALGNLVTIGAESKFIVTGSAVVVAFDDHRGCLLTAKHMLVDPANGQLTQSLWMRRTSEHGEEMPPIQLSLFDPQGKNIWIALPDNDLAVIPLPWAKLTGKPLSAVTIQDFVSDPDDVFQGAQILVLGYPQVFRNPDQTNPYSTSPIARTGVVAWTDPTDSLGKPFLVDANLYGGNSGGPVFRVKSGFNKYGSFNIGGPKLEFIGIVSKGPIMTATVVAGNGVVTQPNPQTGIPENEYAIVPYVGGIGIIEPASKARALLESVFATLPAKVP